MNASGVYPQANNKYNCLLDKDAGSTRQEAYSGIYSNQPIMTRHIMETPEVHEGQAQQLNTPKFETPVLEPANGELDKSALASTKFRTTDESLAKEQKYISDGNRSTIGQHLCRNCEK